MESCLLENQPTWVDPGAPGRKRVPFTVQGSSWAANATGLWIPQWGLLLDAGLRTRIQPRAILITHTHTDHCSELASVCMNKGDAFNVFCRPEAKEPLQMYLESTARLRACSMRVRWNSALFSGKIVDLDPSEGYVSICRVFARGQTPSRREPETKRAKQEPKPLPGSFHPNVPAGCRHLHVRAVSLVHSVPTTGYVVAEERNRLDPQYAGLSQEELDDLRGRGVSLDRMDIVPMLAYFCDCTSESATEAIRSLRGAEPKMVIVECTYISDRDASQAKGRKHVLWSRLAPVTQEFPNVVFLLIHFSRRYQRKELSSFSRSLPPNVFAHC